MNSDMFSAVLIGFKQMTNSMFDEVNPNVQVFLVQGFNSNVCFYFF